MKLSHRSILSILILSTILLLVGLIVWDHYRWSDYAKKDLEALHKNLIENHPASANKKDHAFHDWLERGYQQALKKAESINSYSGYRAILFEYGTGFHDEHLTVDIAPPALAWPGFTVAYNNRQYIVSDIAQNATPFKQLPRVGDQLLSCNGQTADQLMKSNILPYYFGSEKLEADFVANAARLFIDTGNPFIELPKMCTFLHQGKEIALDLTWQPIDMVQVIQLIKKAAGTDVQPTFNIEPFGKNSIWITIPRFSPKDKKDVEELENIAQQMKNFRNKDAVVLDIRSNRGGLVKWCKDILGELYGEPYLEQQYHEDIKPAFKVSEANICYYTQELPQQVEQIYGKESPVYTDTVWVGEQINKACQEGKQVWCQDVCDTCGLCKRVRNPVRAKVILITNCACCSAALIFTDIIKCMPGAIQIGLPTHADTVYNNVRGVSLPSGYSKLNFPTRASYNRKRANNQPHIPNYRFKGDIADTKALKEWVEKKFI